MPPTWKLEEEFSSAHHVFEDIWKSFKGVPLLAWLFLLFGVVGLLYSQGHAPEVFTPGPATGFFAAVVAGIHKLPWLGLVREVSFAAVISFCLALFLEEPLRAQTITRVGRDIAPFLIAALTVPEMRFKMRQICESAVIRKNSKVLLWITPGSQPDRYVLKVQMRSHYCNISNAQQEISARIGVDEDKAGRILVMTLRPIQISGLAEHHWDGSKEAQPNVIDGRRVIEKKITFPKCHNWEQSYIEGTSEYQEEITLISSVGRTLIESLWPLVGIEIECVRRPDDIELKADIPFHEIKRVGNTDRWISPAALLPGQRVDLVITKVKPALGSSVPASTPATVAFSAQVVPPVSGM